MRLMRWRLVAAVTLVLPLVRCAGGPPPAPGAPPGPHAAAAPSVRFSSFAEAEAALVEIEDRRAFDPGVLASAAAAADPAIRARAALAAGRIGDDRGGPLCDPSCRTRRGRCGRWRRSRASCSGTPARPRTFSRFFPTPTRRWPPPPREPSAFWRRGDGEDALVAAIPRAAAARAPRLDAAVSLEVRRQRERVGRAELRGRPGYPGPSRRPLRSLPQADRDVGGGV